MEACHTRSWCGVIRVTSLAGQEIRNISLVAIQMDRITLKISNCVHETQGPRRDPDQATRILIHVTTTGVHQYVRSLSRPVGTTVLNSTS